MQSSARRRYGQSTALAMRIPVPHPTRMGAAALLQLSLLLLAITVSALPPLPSSLSPSLSPSLPDDHASRTPDRIFPASAFAHAPNPRGRQFIVSRSSFHTEQGRLRDAHLEYRGEGQHKELAGVSHDSASGHASSGRHLGEPLVHAFMRQLAEDSFIGNVSHRTPGLLPSIQEALDGVPEQIVLAATSRPGEMVVSWLTWNDSRSQVEFAPSAPWSSVSGSSSEHGALTGPLQVIQGQSLKFIDPNTLHLVRYIHTALLTGLKGRIRYSYRVGDGPAGVWSVWQSFTSLPLPGGADKSVVHIAMYGDLGLVNARCMAALNREAQEGTVDLAVHLGDFAYDLNELQGMVADVWMKGIQPITARVPWMGVPGNHDTAFNFSHYNHRFTAWNYALDPQGRTGKNWYTNDAPRRWGRIEWYSFDVVSGGVLSHFIALDTEVYFGDVDLRRAALQYEWLLADLAHAYDSGRYAWIFALGHRPLYCSNVDEIQDCTRDARRLRLGVDGQWGWDAAFASRPLDAYFCAHEHSYERTYPVNGGRIDWASVRSNHLYVDPLYPTHIVTGSAGNREYLEWFDHVLYGPWSALRSATYGYGRLAVHNRTHAHWVQLLDEGRGGQDELWIVKKPRQAQAPMRDRGKAWEQSAQQQHREERAYEGVAEA